MKQHNNMYNVSFDLNNVVVYMVIVNKGKWSIQGNGATKSKYSEIVYAIVMPTSRRKADGRTAIERRDLRCVDMI